MAKFKKKYVPVDVRIRYDDGWYNVVNIVLKRKYLFIWLTVSIHTIAIKEKNK